LTHWCTMVHGPCRGKACDFWARVKLKQATTDELLEQISQAIGRNTGGQDATDSIIDRYWRRFGLSSLERLHMEEPELFEKVMEVSSRFELRLRTAQSEHQSATCLSNRGQENSESGGNRNHVVPV